LSPLSPRRLVGVALKAFSESPKRLLAKEIAGRLTEPTPTSRRGESGDKPPHSKKRGRNQKIQAGGNIFLAGKFVFLTGEIIFLARRKKK